uniref:Uncharacterized protein n=1 Tax=viral metagenome TaxID=1070528 RepID=A0A6C0D2P7_9ZZZZ
MANFILANAKPDFNQQIVYDFKDTKVKVTSSKSTFFSTSLPDSGNASVIYTNGANVTYTTSNLYVYRLLHNNISGLTDGTSTMVGELVIELKPSTGSKKAYMCFLLENTPSGISETKTSIDELLDPANVGKTINVNVSSFISSMDTCIQYSESKSSNTVFVFLQPIFITDNTYKVITTSGDTKSGYDSTTTLFNTGAPTKYSQIPGQNVKMSGQDEIMIECHPTDSFQTLTSYIEGYDSIGNTMINMVPSTSKDAEKTQIADFSIASATACTILLSIIVCYNLVPTIYKFFVVDKVFSFFSNGNSIDNDGALTRIRSADGVICIYFLLLIVLLYSLTAYQTMFIYFGFLVFAFFVMSYALLYIKKTDTEFMKGLVYKSEDTYSKTGDFGTLLGHTFAFLTENIFYVGFAEIVFLVILLILWGLKQFSDNTTAVIGSVVGVFVIPTVVLLLKLIDLKPR